MRSPAARLTNRNGPTHTGFERKPVAERRQLLGRHDHPRPVGKLRRQRREAGLKPQPDGVVHDRLDRRDRGQLARTRRASERAVPVERDLHRLCVQRLPSLKRTPRRIGIVIVCLSGESVGIADASCGTISSLRVQVVELLAHVQEDHAPDERARERRIQSVRILCEPDRERAARLSAGGRSTSCRRGEQPHRQQRECGAERSSAAGANPLHPSPPGVSAPPGGPPGTTEDSIRLDPFERRLDP